MLRSENQAQGSKEIQVSKLQALLAKHGREPVRVPVTPEPEVVPVPPLAIPDETRDRARAVRVAEDGSPEVGDAGLPFLGNEVGVSVEFLENADVEESLAGLFRSHFQAAEVLLTSDRALAELESKDALDLREVDHGRVSSIRMLDDLEPHQ